MIKVFLLCMLLFPVLTFAQGTIQSTGSKISSEDAQAILDHHNKIRNDLGIPPLTWSTEVAAYAQNWADTLANFNNCHLEHRQNRGQNYKGYGENIFQGSSADSFKPLDASMAWYSEVKDYKYAKLSDDNWAKTAHYTQMIWKNTNQIGVGVATCPGGGVIVVANYNPAGNYLGEAPY